MASILASLVPDRVCFCALVLNWVHLFEETTFPSLSIRLGSISAAVSCPVYAGSFPEQRLEIEPTIRPSTKSPLQSLKTSVWTRDKAGLKQGRGINKVGKIADFGLK